MGKRSSDNVAAGEAAKRGAITGTGMEALFGLLVHMASVWVPGLGPLLVAGTLAAVPFANLFALAQFWRRRHTGRTARPRRLLPANRMRVVGRRQAPPRYEVAEIINLQAIWDEARRKRLLAEGQVHCCDSH